MFSHRASKLRAIAATLVCTSGAAHLASLWFRPLDEGAVASIFIGATYLIVGIGLFGQSRFTLFVATALCAASTAVALRPLPAPLTPMTEVAVAADAIAMLCCIAVLILRWKETPG